MKIRSAVAGDVAAVVALERGVTEAPHWSETDYGAMIGGEEGALRRCFLVGERGGVLVGFAVGKAIGVGLTAELESVVVAQEARRSGVGRALCEAVIEWCHEREAPEVELEVRSLNLGARALYGGLGFEEVGARREYYRDPVDDAVLMRLQISR